jgi:hypothetical protein
VYPIHIRVADTRFPHVQWDDFAVVILGQWLREAQYLLTKRAARAELLFMDGPFEVEICDGGADKWQVTCLRRDAKRNTTILSNVVSSELIWKEIVYAASRAVTYFKQSEAWDNDCQRLHDLLLEFVGWVESSEPTES